MRKGLFLSFLFIFFSLAPQKLYGWGLCDVEIIGPHYLCLGETINLYAHASPSGGSCSWSATPGLSPSGCNATFTGNYEGSFWVNVRYYSSGSHDFKCSDSDMITVGGRDADGDGHYAIGSCAEPADDCDDNDPKVYPGALEICDNKDNNCDGQVDEGLSTDSDGDGHYTLDSCKKPKDDCNDNDPTVYPGALEICDCNKDNNCDGKIDEGCCEVAMSISPSEVWPLNTSSNSEKSKANIVISSIKQAPPVGCVVNLKVQPVDYSGGHSHDGSRPKGIVNPDMITIPGCTMGVASATYNSSGVAGEEKIIAEIDGSIKNQTIIRVRVPNLYPMPGRNYRLTGQRTAHPDNHYGTYYTVVNTSLIGEDYYKDFNATLGINDMSLVWGGLFDIGPPIGSFWSPPHKSHRKGTSVDIDRCAKSAVLENPNPQGICPEGWIKVNRTYIEDSCQDRKGWLIPETTIHCEFPY